MNRLKILLSLFLKNPSTGIAVLFQVARRKLLLDYRLFNNGFSFYPSTIVFHPTARCNLRCKMCVVNTYSFPKELTLTEIKKIIDQIAFFKPHFYIAGGEPLLRRDLEKIIRYAKQKGLVTTLTTNGALLTAARTAKLVRVGIDGVAVSIDGPKKINDQIRGRGHFEKAVAAVRALKDLRSQRGLSLPKIKIATVISGYNFRYLEKMTTMAQAWGADEIIFFHLDYKSQKIAQAHQQCMVKYFGQVAGCLGYVVKDVPAVEERKFIDIDLGILKKEIKKICQKKHPISVSFAPPVPFSKLDDYYQGKYFQKFACTNPWFSTTILPNGDLTPCFSLKIGNLMKKNFNQVWNNNLYKKFRRYLKKNKHFPGCFRCCGTTDL